MGRPSVRQTFASRTLPGSDARLVVRSAAVGAALTGGCSQLDQPIADAPVGRP